MLTNLEHARALFVSAPPVAETATGGASSPLTTDGEG